MNGRFLQSALRELRAILSLPRVWLVFGIVVALFAVTGPFGTSVTLPFHARLGYWLLIHALTWFFALVFVTVFDVLLVGRVAHALPRMLVGAALAALPMGLAIAAVGALVLSRPLSPAEWAVGVANAAPISLALCTLVWMAVDVGDAGETGRQTGFATSIADRPPLRPAIVAPPLPPEPAIVQRLPAGKRAPLVRLEVQDHYVHVVTARGREMVLMRLVDAIRETRPVEGLRIHRSHWIARDAVVAVERSAGVNARSFVRMADGALVPVSRANVAALKAWPKSAP